MLRATRARRLRALLPTLVVAAAVAACGSATGSPASSPSATVPASMPSASATPAPSPSEAGASPSDVPATSAPPSASSAANGAGCTGTAGNRDFFASIAQSVTWSVYCAALPDGWFIESGNYRLRNQGQMQVAYRGPNGTHFEIQEGAFCADSNGCVPAGQAAGAGQFGDLDGTLYALDGGGLGLVVDQGAAISWLAIGGNLDESTFLALTAALQRVD